ncbi:FAD-binding oxidoreductase [Enterovirga sp. GCM10030262]|uniref:FAD-binding oxidoreductase n=1 Tax=Enterovirga sp. GCM10030262 TaxID=3273391 RepID=UPI0036145196
MSNPPSPALLATLMDRLGPRGFTTEPADLAPWLTDWRRLYRGRAAAMLSPAGVEEVSDIVRLCAREGVALVPQGGNSSMAGGATPDATGEALLLSMRRMNRLRSISADANVAVAEAGLILAHLHDAAAEVGRRFPLTLGARGSATIGGLVSTNAGGTQVLRFGTMRGLVEGIEAVLPDGSVFNGLASLKKDNRGYDIRQLLIGAEGTLGIVTAASLKLVPAIGSRSVAWVGLESPRKALALLRLLDNAVGDAVESFELVPREALDLVLRHVAGTRAPLEGGHDWHVLIEAVAPMVAPDPEKELGRALRAALKIGVAEDAVVAASEAQAEAFWRIRDSISEAEKKDGPAAKHDLSVEVAAMPDFMVEAASAVEARFPGTRPFAFGHLGDGNVHFNVRAPLDADEAWLGGEAPAVTAFVHDLITAAGGSISAEHGIGQMRLAELARLGDPTRLAAMRAIKNALDPKNIMNPGKLVPPLDAAQESLA